MQEQEAQTCLLIRPKNEPIRGNAIRKTSAGTTSLPRLRSGQHVTGYWQRADVACEVRFRIVQQRQDGRLIGTVTDVGEFAHEAGFSEGKKFLFPTNVVWELHQA